MRTNSRTVVIEGRGVLLGNIGEPLRPVPLGHQGRYPGLRKDRAFRPPGRMPLRHLRRVVFPAPFGSDDRGQLGPGEIEVLDMERKVAIAERQILDADAHCQTLLDFLKRKMKKGMPIRLVKIPTGTSKEARLRARSSARIKKAAPSAAEKGMTLRLSASAGHPDEVGNNEADPADDSGDGRGGRSDQRRQEDNQEFFPADIDAERFVPLRRS